MTPPTEQNIAAQQCGQAWEWRIEGQQISVGTMHWSAEASGVIQAEGAGDALRWLLDRSDVWDNVDQDEEISISLRPVSS